MLFFYQAFGLRARADPGELMLGTDAATDADKWTSFSLVEAEPLNVVQRSRKVGQSGPSSVSLRLIRSP